MSKSLVDNPFITEMIDKNGDSWYHQIVLELKDKEIERLNNIIKEVREYIEDNKEYTLIEKSSNQDFKGIPTFYYTNEDILNQEMIEKLLEILDKDSDKE